MKRILRALWIVLGCLLFGFGMSFATRTRPGLIFVSIVAFIGMGWMAWDMTASADKQ